MLAHYHGQTWKSSEFPRSFGVADKTVRNCLDQQKLYIVHAGHDTFPLQRKVTAITALRLFEDLS